MAQTKAQKKRAIEAKKRNTVKSGKYKGWHVEITKTSNGKKPCEWCNGEGQIFRNRSEMESGEGMKCKKCRGNGY